MCPPVLFLDLRSASPRPEVCETDLWSGAASRTRKMTKIFNVAQVRAPSVDGQSSSGVRSPVDSPGVPKPDLGDRSDAHQASQPKCARPGSVPPARSYRTLPMPFVRFQPPVSSLQLPELARHTLSSKLRRISLKTNDRRPRRVTHFSQLRAPVLESGKIAGNSRRVLAILLGFSVLGSDTGNRTRIWALRGLRPNP
jgi:hypothetical protein